MQSNRCPEPGSTLRSVKRAGKPFAKAPSRLSGFWRAFDSTEAIDRLHHESRSDSDGAEMRSDRLFCLSRASVNLSISLERRFARRTVPSESSTMSASPLDSKTALNAAPSKSCIISERGVEGTLRSAVSTLPVRLAFMRFGIQASPVRLQNPVAAQKCCAYRKGIFEGASSNSDWAFIDIGRDISDGWHALSSAQRRPCS